jgi:hypothetical protein
MEKELCWIVPLLSASPAVIISIAAFLTARSGKRLAIKVELALNGKDNGNNDVRATAGANS